jgi:archaellum biogenesis ATPase FlaH/5S rRNA maturation endonuclease (ribonuclease M5)
VSRQNWLVAVKQSPIENVIQVLPMSMGRMRSFTPCPACNEKQRGSSDKRGPCGITSDRRAWCCHRCGVKGDAIDLISWAKIGSPSKHITKSDWESIKSFVVESGLASEDDIKPVPPVREMTTYTDRLLGKGGGGTRPPKLLRGSGAGIGEQDLAVAPQEPARQRATGGKFGWRDGLAEDCEEDLWSDSECGQIVLKYLRDERKFSEDTIKHFNLGCTVIDGDPWLTIPLKDKSERIINIRFRSVPPQKKTYRVCTGMELPLFGADKLPSNFSSPIIIVEGELDVIAMHEYGISDCVVTGTAGASAFKEEWLDCLESYTSFILAYDDDKAGNKGAEDFANKMGVERCSRAVMPKKDVGQCLSEAVPRESVRRVIDLAQPMFGPKFRRVSEYGEDIEKLVSSPEELMGRTTGSQRIDRCLGGLRPGLMVVSGDTGHGKTTFATWLLWRQAYDGTPVMITSFEQRPVGTVQKLLRMQLGGDFTKCGPDERRQSLTELGDMPLHVLDHYGHLPAEDLMQSIRYAVRRLGVKVVLIDHLGFLLTAESQDRVSQIEGIIRALAVTGYGLGITVILVCHPKGTPPGHERITINDLKGASAIKQDASEVVIVERAPPDPHENPPRHWPASWIHFDKVRSEFGIPGSKAQLAFGPLSCIYADVWGATPEGGRGELTDDF